MRNKFLIFGVIVFEMTTPTIVAAQSCPALSNSPWGISTSAGTTLDYPGETTNSPPEINLPYALAKWVPNILSSANVSQYRGAFSKQTSQASSQVADLGTIAAYGILQDGTTQFPLYSDWSTYINAPAGVGSGATGGQFSNVPSAHYWEVWNEPDTHTSNPLANPANDGNGDPAQYATLANNAHQFAANLTGGCVPAYGPPLIGINAANSDIAWHASVINAGHALGFSNFFDFLSLHPYSSATNLIYGADGQYMGIAPTVRKMLKAKGYSVNIPIQFTEFGVPLTNFGPSKIPLPGGEQAQADVLIKGYTMGLAQNLASVNWFSTVDIYMNGASTPTPGTDFGLLKGTLSSLTARQSLIELGTLIKELGSNPQFIGWLTLAPSVVGGTDQYGFVFCTTGNSCSASSSNVSVVAWASPNNSVTASIPGAYNIVNWNSGNVSAGGSNLSLTGSPVLLQATGSQASTWYSAATGNVGKVFPWRGTYDSKAGATSVTMGGSAASEAGLHLVLKPYGTSGVHCGDTGNPPPTLDASQQNLTTNFAVDPNFYSYYGFPTGYTRMQITALVCANSATAPAKFSLTYETHAYDSAALTETPGHQASGVGPVTLSNASSWTTVSWTLPAVTNVNNPLQAPEFNSQYGYNFFFAATSTSTNGYSIKSVSVQFLP